jgi:glycerol-3-phosphate dehydrogenase
VTDAVGRANLAAQPTARATAAGGASTALSPAHREWSRRRLASEVLDILVVGGGVTGTGAVLDAASRGLSAGLIEARDYAAGASSKSSKLIHGGLRYLEMLDFALVREALRERQLLLTKLAPHLVKPVPFMWPLTHRVWERPYLAAGLLLYDTMGGRHAVPRARQLTRTQALRIAPALDPGRFVGAAQFYDAQEDDARLVAYLARTAAEFSAALATSMPMVSLLHDGGRVQGVTARDLLSGDYLTIRARHVVLATGAWTTGEQLTVRPSKGVHITVPRSRIEMQSGLLMRTDKSVLFVIPWGEHWLIGDTDTEWSYDPAYPAANRADIEYLLAKVNSVLRDPLTRADVVGVFAGLRPLVAASPAADTTKLSREHTVRSPAPGLSVIGGGKYTTYRVMARDLIDAAARDLTGDGSSVPPSRTADIPLVGADGWAELWSSRAQIAADADLPLPQVERLLGRYGGCISELLQLIGARPALARPLDGAGSYLRAEMVYACSHEGAVHLDDVLARRTRSAIETRDRGLAAAPETAALMAAELGWSQQQAEAEVARYRSAVTAQLAGEASDDDAAAYQAVSAVPDLAASVGPAPAPS